MRSHEGGIEIDPPALARALEAGAPVQVLDVRAPQRLAAGQVGPVPPERFVNVPGSEILAMADLDGLGIDAKLPVAVVCGHGNDSLVIAKWLQARGYDATSLRGGISAWMRLTVPRRVDPPPGFDLLLQFDRVGKGALGYVLVSDGEALIIDPPRDWQPHVEAAESAGARVKCVADTHVHADYISGAPSLAAELGVPYHLHPADAVYPYDGTPGRLTFSSLADGKTLELGRGLVTARHTPGHTEGSVTLVAPGVDGETGGVAFSGDFIFIDSVGRPDLAGKTQQWCGDLWRSLQWAKTSWPDDLVVCPGHYASEGERNSDRSVARAFGSIMQKNGSLLIDDEVTFREWVESSVSIPPPAYRRIKAVNAGLLSASPSEADVLEAGRNECAVG
jgi:glyoxylase-like metal-dependent hydrolase (beta-lactamase superfamily II)